jgi:peptidoglycan/LPS O-acetylase OafA/YrhL
MHKNAQAHQILGAPTERLTMRQLDVIRVLAMLGIFLHHLWKTVIVAPQGNLQSALDILFSAASDGVVLFNIISGFMLAIPYLGPECRPFAGYRSFLQKRFLRIIPPYYLALFIFTLANILRFGFPLVPAVDTLLEHLLFINSLNYANMSLNFSHFWYLGLLAQFYLLFPFVLTLFLRIGAARAALSIIVFCWGGWMILAGHIPATDGGYPGLAENLMHFNLPGRLPEFAIGMWLASLWNPSTVSVRRPALGRSFSLFTAAMVLYIIVGMPFSSNTSLPLIHIHHVALSEVLFLILLVWPPVARAGECASLKAIAEQSYAVYIVHEPLFSYLGVMPSKTTHNLGSFVILMAVLLPMSYLLARILNLVSAEIMNRFS